jgi:phosphoglucosamine mutase
MALADMNTRLFGTDGVRGTAGQPPLDRTTIARLGAALVRVLPHRGAGRILVGRDTRESGEWIEQVLARGVTSEGAQLVSAGVVPTPAIAYLTRASDAFDAGIVISASHNPFQDNGIKVFSGRGEKFDARAEAEIEALVADPAFVVDTERPAAVEREDLVDVYIRHAREALPDPSPLLRGLHRRTRIALDCANGATTTVAPRLFRELGFDVTVIGGEPDGRNINLNSGSTHPETLQALVRADGFRLGVAFDGDGDRAILVDDEGRLVDGDAVLLMSAKHMQMQGRLRGPAVVATVMSNIGLEIALRDLGIDLIRCPVGDKYVMEEILKRQLSLGGEQSGHIIFSDYLFTGDGIVTALCVLRTMAESGRELADLASDLKTYPQVLVNVPVRERRDLKDIPEVADAMRRVEARLDGQGRLLVRYSGTEPLLRIMIEGRDQQEIQRWADEIAEGVRQALG